MNHNDEYDALYQNSGHDQMSRQAANNSPALVRSEGQIQQLDGDNSHNSRVAYNQSQLPSINTIQSQTNSNSSEDRNER